MKIILEDFNQEDIEKLIEFMRKSDEHVENERLIIEFDEQRLGMLNNYCKYCSNNPSNGGSGICHCILGSPVIY